MGEDAEQVFADSLGLPAGELCDLSFLVGNNQEGRNRMFTGIVEELGMVRSVVSQGAGCRLTVNAELVLSEVKLGDSISVSGCCLTVVDFGADEKGSWFAADAVPETLDRTILGQLSVEDLVNLERSMPANGRFGGHVVQGHVDGVIQLKKVQSLDDGSQRLTFHLPEMLAGQIVEKGSVALDGISLTVASVNHDEASFDIAVVPHTLAVTTLGHKVRGDSVNVEADVFARYVAGLLKAKFVQENKEQA